MAPSLRAKLSLPTSRWDLVRSPQQVKWLEAVLRDLDASRDAERAT